MSSWTKVLVVVIGLVVVAFAVELYFYFGVQKGTLTKLVLNPAPSSVPTPTTIPSGPNTIEMKSPAIIKGVNLFDITKETVIGLATQGGMAKIPTYNGPSPSLSPRPGIIFTETKADIPALAGNFQTAEEKKFIILQKSQPVEVNFSEGSKLWIRTGTKLEMVTIGLDQLISSGYLNIFIKAHDPVLILDIKNTNSPYSASSLVIFR